MSQQVVERLVTQTSHHLMKPRDPQETLKALGLLWHSSQLLALRVSFQLFLMHSRAQATELTWPKWNHSILSTLPMEQQQQILPGKSCLPSLLRSRTLQALQVFMLSAALPVLFLCNWCKTNCVYTVLNSWWCTFNKKTRQTALFGERAAPARGNEQWCSHGVPAAASHTKWGVCCPNCDTSRERGNKWTSAQCTACAHVGIFLVQAFIHSTIHIFMMETFKCKHSNLVRMRHMAISLGINKASWILRSV